MNVNYTRLGARFGPQTRFTVKPAPAAARAFQADALERLKNRLLGEQLAGTEQLGLGARLQRAANEAAALAWTTTFPLLVFPALFDEKVRTALLQAQRQAGVRERSRELLAA